MRTMRIVSIAAGMAIAATACGEDGGTSPPIRPAASQNNSGGNGSNGNGSNGTPGSNNTFAIMPRALALLPGTYGQLVVVDANGKIVTGAATFRSSNPNVAVVSDTGVVYGKSVGAAAIFVTFGGVLDSAEVVVLNATNVVAGVSSFNLSLTVLGTTSPGDTLSQAPVVGATVAATRTMTYKGDTLKTPDPAVAVTTNSQGVARFENLPGGAYNIAITPPPGSPYLPTKGSFFPPTVTEFSATLLTFKHL
jgi:hypothetical protein